MPEWVIPVVVALVAALPGLYATWQQRGATDAEATDKIADAAVGLLDDFREENKALRQRAVDLEVEKQTLYETLMTYMGQNRLLEAENQRLKGLLEEQRDVE